MSADYTAIFAELCSLSAVCALVVDEPSKWMFLLLDIPRIADPCQFHHVRALGIFLDETLVTRH
jgi:hypothetical protein